MTSQKQTGGDSSTNVQVGTIHVGLGYDDVKSIAKDVFDQNFASLAQQASNVASARAEEIREEIIGRLSRDGVNPNNFSHVEKQVALLDAQRAYAISGDEDLRQILVDAVIGMAPENERSLKSIVLQESIKIINSLTADQIKILAVVFVVRYVNFGSVGSLDILINKYISYSSFSSAFMDITPGYLRHLEYLGCGKQSLASVSLFDLVASEYPGLISRGYDLDELMQAFLPDSLPHGGILPCLRDASLHQIAALNQRVIEEKSTYWSTHQKSVAIEKLSSNLIDHLQFEKELSDISSEASSFNIAWDAKGFSSFELTSVGMAIGHTYASARGMTADLNIWL